MKNRAFYGDITCSIVVSVIGYLYAIKYSYFVDRKIRFRTKILCSI